MINNGYLGMVRQWQEFFYDKRYAATPMLSPDFVKLAEAYGIAGHRVTQRDETSRRAVEAARARGRAGADRLPGREGGRVYPMVPAGRRPARDDPPAARRRRE